MYDDARDTPELPPGQGLGEAALKVGPDSIPVLLVEESGSGFVIHAERHPGLYEGETVWLQTGSRCAQVDVVSVMTVARGVQIELARVEARDEDEDPQPGPSRLGMACSALRDRRVRIVLMGILAVSIAALELRHGKVTIESTLAMIPFLQEEPEDPDAWMQDSVGPAVKQEGAGVFLTEPVAAALALNESQRRRIGIIAVRTQRTVEMATAGGSSDDYIEQVKIESHQKALAVLSKGQRRRWSHWLKLAEEELRQKRRQPARRDE